MQEKTAAAAYVTRSPLYILFIAYRLCVCFAALYYQAVLIVGI